MPKLRENKEAQNGSANGSAAGTDTSTLTVPKTHSENNGHDGGAPAATPTAPAIREAQAKGAPPPMTPNNSDGDAAPAARKRSPVKGLLFVVLAVGVVFGALWGIRAWHWGQSHISTDDAYLTTDIVQITPQVNGNLAQILVNDNQPVHKGQLLAVIDDATYRSEVEQDKANLNVALAGLSGAQANVNLTQATGESQIQQAQGGVLQSQSGVGTAEANVRQAQAGVVNAQTGVQGARDNVLTAQANISGAEETTRRTALSAEAARTAIGAATAERSRAIQLANAAQADITTAQTTRDRALAAVSAAQANVEQARAAVTTAEANVAAAQAQADRAAADYTRYQSLFQGGAVSRQTLDQALAETKSATASVNAAREAVHQAQSAVTAREADVTSAREQVRATESAITQARAQYAAARNAAGSAGANVNQARAQYAAANAAIKEAQSTVARNRTQLLAAQDAIAQAQSVVGQNAAQVQAARQGVGEAQGKRVQSQGQLNQARTLPRQLEVGQTNIQTAKAKVTQAQAALQNALINLRRTHIVAPIDGIVSKRNAMIGQQVTVGQAILALVPQNIWVVANYKETQLTDVKNGQAADIEVDAFPGHTYHGHVDSISAGTGAVFSLLPPENASGNFTKVVQRVPVKIVFDRNQKDLDRLRGGLSVAATIDTKS